MERFSVFGMNQRRFLVFYKDEEYRISDISDMVLVKDRGLTRRDRYSISLILNDNSHIPLAEYSASSYNRRVEIATRISEFSGIPFDK